MRKQAKTAKKEATYSLRIYDIVLSNLEAALVEAKFFKQADKINNISRNIQQLREDKQRFENDIIL